MDIDNNSLQTDSWPKFIIMVQGLAFFLHSLYEPGEILWWLWKYCYDYYYIITGQDMTAVF